MQAITRETLLGMGRETLVEQIDQDTGDGTGGYVSGNGLRTAHQYAVPDGSITAIDIDRVMNLKYRFDESGRIVGIDVNGTLRRYAYGQIGLTMAESAGAVHRFEYDAVGNRTASSKEGSDGSLSATRYDYPERGKGNRLLGVTEFSGEAGSDDTPLQRQDSRRFSASGAPEQANGYRYEYDTAQRPIKVFDDSELLAEYAYNGFGERIRKVVYRGDQKKVTYYLYDGHQLTAEIDGESGTFKQGVFLEDSPVAYLVGSDTYAVHTDHLGTPKVVTDENGETVWSADYDPFGHATITTGATATEVAGFDLPYRLPGQYFDSETGTHYNYLRDYDPATGRYITSDPIGLHGGMNTYAYALNDPLGLSDPLGLFSISTGTTVAQGTGFGADSPDKPSAGDASEQAYTDKLTKVLDYAIKDLKDNKPGDVAIKFLEDMVANVAVIAGVVAALAAAHVAGVGVAADAVLLAAGWLLAGYEAGKFLYNTIVLMVELDETDLCDEAALQGMGRQFAGSIGDLGQALAESALLGGLNKISGALKDAARYAGDGAWTLWRKLKARFGEDATNGGLCSFAGDTLVITDSGYKPIRDIEQQHDRVWAKDERTGIMGWRNVLAQYSNRYEETVRVTAVDGKGRRQTITSNRIHPYFARVAAGAILATASISTSPVMASEGHVYAGEIAGGAWVDAQYLQPGDELLGATGMWQTVIDVTLEAEPLQAFNLSVAEYSTYFVSGERSATPVWVHNDCYDRGPNGEPPNGFTQTSGPNGETNFGQPTYLGDDGRVIYRGHDGKFYDIVKYPPTPSPPRFTIGANDGGPGLWKVENGLSASNAQYQSRDTGSPNGQQYLVPYDGVPSGRVSFDGYNPATNTLIDAKKWRSWPIDRQFSRDSVLDQAERQVGAASNSGASIEWHIPSEDKAQLVRQWLRTAGYSNIKIVLTP